MDNRIPAYPHKLWQSGVWRKSQGKGGRIQSRRADRRL